MPSSLIPTRVRHGLHLAGLSRSSLVRRLVRLGHPRLRRWSERVEASPPLRRLTSPAAAWLNRGSIVVPSGLGHGLRLSKADLPLSHAHLGALAFGSLEASVQEAMLRLLGPGDVFYDVGANLGFFTLLGARMAGPGGRAIAFEPAPANAAAIRRNAELNRMANVTVRECAAGAQGGRARLQVVDDQSWSKLEDYGAHPGTQEVLDVELVAIDDLVSSGELPPPTVVKIDVEGAELAVLEGMRNTLAHHRPAVICELHDTNQAFVDLIDSLGYRTINLEGTASITESGPSAHALAIPADAVTA